MARRLLSLALTGYQSLIDRYPRAVATILQSILIGKVHETMAARQASRVDW